MRRADPQPGGDLDGGAIGRLPLLRGEFADGKRVGKRVTWLLFRYIYYVRICNLIVPAFMLAIEENPDKSQEKGDCRNPIPEIANKRPANR